MQITCASSNVYRSIYASVSKKYIDFLKKNQIIERAWNAQIIGKEEKAKELYIQATQYQGLLNLLYILEVRKRLYEECWNTYISEIELQCLIDSFRCAGIDIKPLLKEFNIDFNNIICVYIPCDGEGLGNTGISHPECPFKVYPNSGCNVGGIGDMEISGINCTFIVS